ncbi:MAG: DNA recombination protein RmuC [Nitrospiraceae bacterium]|nr:DNA recombination protein RmuC [Nitrospiraceae bacterium]
MQEVELLRYVLLGFVAFVFGVCVGMALLWRSRGKLRDETTQLRNDAELAKIQLAHSEASLQAETEKTNWTEDAKSQFKEAFKTLATEELEARSTQLKETAKDQLGVIVDPLKQELTKLDKYVRELEGKREGAYSRLGTQLELLQGLQQSLRDQTTSLAEALKAPTVRGRWGEVQLRRLIELAGLQDHVDFDEQVSGEAGRPDMIVHLPQGGTLPIDAKVPLDAFLRAMETEDIQMRKQNLVHHARALKSRVQDLAQKAYWEQFEITPEIVIMFVPVESSLGAAFQSDPDLFEYAISKKVLISSPIVLFALLKAVAYGWQQHRIAENAAKIAEEGRTLHDRVVTFVGHLAGMGKSLESSVKKYNDAITSFERRLLPSSKKFLEMGVTTKTIEPPEHVESHPQTPSSTEEHQNISHS